MNAEAATPAFTLWTGMVNSWVIPFVFLFIVSYGYAKKVKVYELFVEGAKEGFNVAVTVIPYLVVILAGIAIFRASGAMDFLARGIGFFVPSEYFPSDLVLLALVKPMSGSAARGVMLDVFTRQGPDSFPGFLASCIQGSTETTFYVVALYLGSIGVRRSRHIIPVGLCAELVAIVVSAIVANFIFMGRK